MEIVVRAAARVLCVDSDDRILLLLWRDPASAGLLWEPPGGGIEEGERPVDAARRELTEETGWTIPHVRDSYVMVPRNVKWNGKHFVGEEAFFFARVDEPRPLKRHGLQEHEAAWLQDYRWVPWDQLGLLPERVEPPDIPSILAELDPDGNWASILDPYAAAVT